MEKRLKALEDKVNALEERLKSVEKVDAEALIRQFENAMSQAVQTASCGRQQGDDRTE